MKGGGRGKEPPVEGELSGKRPRRKCLQWHPLLSKKALDFSEEEEDDEEEELDKESLTCGENVTPDAECRAIEEEEGEEESSEQRARRPMNAFLLFCKRHRSLVRQEHPRLDNRGATKILADWWAVLEPTEKQKYTDMAKEYKDAFMKANPGYKWCPTTNKPVKSSAHAVGGNRKKVWSFPSNTAAKKPAKTDSTPQLNFAMADPTKMGGLSMLLLAGERALSSREVSSNTLPVTADSEKQGRRSALFQLAEISSSSSQSGDTDVTKDTEKCPLFQLAEISSSSPQSNVASVATVERGTAATDLAAASEAPLVVGVSPPKAPVNSALFQLAEISSSSTQSTEGKQCGQSALFQLAEMCLASEAVKIETLGSQSASSCSAVDPESRELPCDSQDARDLPLSSPSSSTSSSSCSSSTTPTDDSPPTLGQAKTVKKKKKKKKKDAGEAAELDVPSGSLKKSCKRRQSSESDLKSVIYTIEAVAKGAWGGDKAQKRKSRPSVGDKHDPEEPGSPKKKMKAKVKKAPKTKEDEDCGEDCKASQVEELLTSLEKENKGASVKTEALEVREEPSPPSPPVVPLLLVKAEEKETESKPESCGSRKSERTCKGALYKTLVSEGMLTSLRANVDRGKRGSGRGSASDLEGSWMDETWAFPQSGSSSTKKLKKPRWKDESLPGLGKLEEEFEKKFNSLPQYSPLTFDRKNTSVTRKKKASGNGSTEQPKSAKGSSSSQKKNLFHKIVSKYKHKKERSNSLDKAIATQDPTTVDTAQKAKSSAPGVFSSSETLGAAEMLVGSQKRKARKSKITHLVRTADGRVSPADEDKAKEQIQDQDEKPSPQETLCNEPGCYTDPNPQGACATAATVSDLPTFFSLAALAEVAAMENVHRNQRAVGMPGEGQSQEMTQTPVLISCADQ